MIKSKSSCQICHSKTTLPKTKTPNTSPQLRINAIKILHKIPSENCAVYTCWCNWNILNSVQDQLMSWGQTLQERPPAAAEQLSSWSADNSNTGVQESFSHCCFCELQNNKTKQTNKKTTQKLLSTKSGNLRHCEHLLSQPSGNEFPWER